MVLKNASEGKAARILPCRSMLLLICVFLCILSEGDSVEDVDFSSLDPATVNQIVIMYRSGEALSDSAVAVMEDVERMVKESKLPGSEAMVFRKCDASKGENGPGMSSKGIETFPMIFVSVEGQGMGEYVILFLFAMDVFLERLEGSFCVSLPRRRIQGNPYDLNLVPGRPICKGDGDEPAFSIHLDKTGDNNRRGRFSVFRRPHHRRVPCLCQILRKLVFSLPRHEKGL
jgi:hypothetical protein